MEKDLHRKSIDQLQKEKVCFDINILYIFIFIQL